MKEFTNKDIRVGDIITLRNGKRAEWNGYEIEIEVDCHLEKEQINRNLTNSGNLGRELDIVKIERPLVVYERVD